MRKCLILLAVLAVCSCDDGFDPNTIPAIDESPGEPFAEGPETTVAEAEAVSPRRACERPLSPLKRTTPPCGTTTTLPCTTFEDVTALADLESPLGGSSAGDVITFADMDGDGLLDLLRTHSNLVGAWKNLGDGTFEEWSGQWLLDGVGSGNTLVPADVDGDGWLDLLSLGDGTGSIHRGGPSGFAPIDGALGGIPLDEAVTGAFADYDGDGDLDLFVAQEPDLSHPGYLLRNAGDGTFEDVTTAAGITAAAGPVLQAHWFDYDDDGDPDLVLANDRGSYWGIPTQLFRNDSGSFVDVTESAGLGPPIDGMGIVSGDVDGDGHFDLYVSNSPHVPVFGMGNLLLRNQGDGTFAEVSTLLGVEGLHIGWAVAMPDFDNDGDLDLLVAADNSHDGSDGTRFFENLGTDGFRDVTEAVGLARTEAAAYGATVGDYDGDGYPDIAIAHTSYGPPIALHRNLGGTNHWVKVRLRGTPPNTFGIGAKVTATIGERTLVRHVHAGSGFGGANPPEVILGLGTELLVDTIEVRWRSGATTEVRCVSADQVLEIPQG